MTRIESLLEYFYETLCLSCYKCLLLKFLFKNEPCGIKGQVRVTFCKLQCNAFIATSSYLQYQGVEQKSRHILLVLVLGWLNYFHLKKLSFIYWSKIKYFLRSFWLIVQKYLVLVDLILSFWLNWMMWCIMGGDNYFLFIISYSFLKLGDLFDSKVKTLHVF